MTADEAKDAILSAAKALPKPVNVDDIFAIATQILDPKRALEFGKWLDKNGTALCARLNN